MVFNPSVSGGEGGGSAHVVLASVGVGPNMGANPDFGIHYTKPDGTHGVAKYPDETSDLELDVLKGSFIVPYMPIDFKLVPSGGTQYIIKDAFNDEISHEFSIYLVNSGGTIG